MIWFLIYVAPNLNKFKIKAKGPVDKSSSVFTVITTNYNVKNEMI